MTQVHERERQLQAELAEKVGAALPDVEVLAVELRGPEQLTVYLDRPEGVDLALCEQVTRMLGEYRERYGLEVSSPGIERPLRTREHFARQVGRKVALRTARDLDGRRRFRGQVADVNDEAVTLATPSGEQVAVPYAQIVRGNLIDEGLRP
jgi:ribosome maturation factor RimP